jgi:hypothetical protein
MADPIRWRVTVKEPFVIGDMVFGPARVDGKKAGYPSYRVSPEVYNSTVDGKPFKDLCATADPEYPRE